MSNNLVFRQDASLESEKMIDVANEFMGHWIRGAKHSFPVHGASGK
jgi:hypothetical protein